MASTGETGSGTRAKLGGRIKPPKEAHRAARTIDAHGHPLIGGSPDPASADCKARRTDAVSVRSLLDVMADFDRFGGASLELVTWELCIEESAVLAAWSRAVADSLIEPSETHEVPGETTWRLTTWGRRARENSDDLPA